MRSAIKSKATLPLLTCTKPAGNRKYPSCAFCHAACSGFVKVLMCVLKNIHRMCCKAITLGKPNQTTCQVCFESKDAPSRVPRVNDAHVCALVAAVQQKAHQGPLSVMKGRSETSAIKWKFLQNPPPPSRHKSSTTQGVWLIESLQRTQ